MYSFETVILSFYLFRVIKHIVYYTDFVKTYTKGCIKYVIPTIHIMHIINIMNKLYILLRLHPFFLYLHILTKDCILVSNF